MACRWAADADKQGTGKRQRYDWAICDRCSGESIGARSTAVRIHKRQGLVYETGSSLKAGWREKGYGTEELKAILRLARDHLGYGSRTLGWTRKTVGPPTFTSGVGSASMADDRDGACQMGRAWKLWSCGTNSEPTALPSGRPSAFGQVGLVIPRVSRLRCPPMPSPGTFGPGLTRMWVTRGYVSFLRTAVNGSGPGDAATQPALVRCTLWLTNRPSLHWSSRF